MIAEFTMHWPSFILGAAGISLVAGIALMRAGILNTDEKAAMRKAHREDVMRLEQENQELLHRELAGLNRGEL